MRHNSLWQGEATMVVSLFVFGRKQVIIGAKKMLGAKTRYHSSDDAIQAQNHEGRPIATRQTLCK
jgi:hypothetical protein